MQLVALQQVLAAECVLLLQNVFSYYRMCSLTTDATGSVTAGPSSSRHITRTHRPMATSRNRTRHVIAVSRHADLRVRRDRAMSARGTSIGRGSREGHAPLAGRLRTVNLFASVAGLDRVRSCCQRQRGGEGGWGVWVGGVLGCRRWSCCI